MHRVKPTEGVLVYSHQKRYKALPAILAALIALVFSSFANAATVQKPGHPQKAHAVVHHKVIAGNTARSNHTSYTVKTAPVRGELLTATPAVRSPIDASWGTSVPPGTDASWGTSAPQGTDASWGTSVPETATASWGT